MYWSSLYEKHSSLIPLDEWNTPLAHNDAAWNGPELCAFCGAFSFVYELDDGEYENRRIKFICERVNPVGAGHSLLALLYSTTPGGKNASICDDCFGKDPFKSFFSRIEEIGELERSANQLKRSISNVKRLQCENNGAVKNAKVTGLSVSEGPRGLTG